MKKYHFILKDFFDRLAALLSLLWFWPVLLIIAILIKLNDKTKPVLFKQYRPGQYGKPFVIYKFRTMSNGEITKTVKIDYAKAGATAGFILNTLAEAVVKVAKGGAWYDLQQAKEDVVPTLVGITKTIAPLGKGLYLFGLDKIPVSFDANGNAIETVTVDYVQAGKNVAEILSVLTNAIVNIAKSSGWVDLKQAKDDVVPTLIDITKMIADFKAAEQN